VPKHRVAETLVLPWNDRDAVERLLTRHAPEIAAVVVDPLSNRMGFIPPAPGFLDHVRRVTLALGILVIFDEVISFRVAAGGSGAWAPISARGSARGCASTASRDTSPGTPRCSAS